MLIHPYNPDWPKQFQQLREILLGDIPVSATLEHVGSTAVPNLPAKAIIDMDLVYVNPSDFLALKEHLEGLGYYHNGNQGIPQREAFKRSSAKPSSFSALDSIRHHLYVCPQDSRELRRHLTFRDYLRNHEKARATYAQLKREIAQRANQDRKVYAQMKEKAARAFVEEILAKASHEKNP